MLLCRVEFTQIICHFCMCKALITKMTTGKIQFLNSDISLFFLASMHTTSNWGVHCETRLENKSNTRHSSQKHLWLYSNRMFASSLFYNDAAVGFWYFSVLWYPLNVYSNSSCSSTELSQVKVPLNRQLMFSQPLLHLSTCPYQ